MTSITLPEAAVLSEDVVKAGVIMEIITVDQFFTQLPFEQVVGEAHIYSRESTEAGAGFHGVGDTTTASPATFTRVSNPLKRILGDVNMDQMVKIVRSNTNDQLAVQIALVAKRIGRIFKDKLINGDVGVDPDEFDGLENLVDASQRFDAGADPFGAALSFELLDQLFDLITAKDGEIDFCIMNARTRRSLMALYRALGGTTPEKVTREGFNEAILAYRGVPVYRNDNVATAAAVSPATAGLVSVWAGCFGERVGLVGTMPVAVDDMIQISESFLHPDRDEEIVRLRAITSLSLYSTKALAALDNINN